MQKCKTTPKRQSLELTVNVIKNFYDRMSQQLLTPVWVTTIKPKTAINEELAIGLYLPYLATLVMKNDFANSDSDFV